MRVRAVILRLLGLMCALTAVFFAAFFIAIAMRDRGNSRAVSLDPPRALAQAEPRSDVSVEVLDLVSENPSAVAPASSTETFVSDSGAPESSTSDSGAPDDLAAEAEPDGPRPQLPQLAAPFDNVRDDLGDTLTIPVRLPGQLDTDANGWVSTLTSIDPNGYILHLDRNVDCDGSSACRVSTFTARRSQQLAPQLGAGTPVLLPNGLSGVLADSACGEGCNNTFLTWIEDGVRYSVGSRVTSGVQVLDLAWRSIDGALVKPKASEVCGRWGPTNATREGRIVTTLTPDGRTMTWIAVCSTLGMNVEPLGAPGELRWQNTGRDTKFDAVVTYDDASSTIFAVDRIRPRAIIDATTGRRLLVADLACTTQASGRVAVDKATGERLDFVTKYSALRVKDESLSGANFVDC